MKKLTKGWDFKNKFVYLGMEKNNKVMTIQTKFKYAAVTPDNEFPLHFSEKHIYVHKKLAEKNLDYWIRVYELSLVRNVEFDYDIEGLKTGLEILKSCKIVKIKVTFEVAE